MKVKHLAGIVFGIVFALAAARCGVRGADDSVCWGNVPECKEAGAADTIDLFDMLSLPVLFGGFVLVVWLLVEHAETEVWTRRKREPKPKPVEQVCPECKRVSEYR